MSQRNSRIASRSTNSSARRLRSIVHQITLIMKVSRKRKRSDSYETYLYRVFKLLHPDLEITKRAMMIMNSFVKDMFGRLARKSARLAEIAKRRTITAREIQTATRQVIRRKLARQGINEARTALTKYNKSKRKAR